ncbi:MAG: DEAD/DEAH box helicase [Thermoguttaceae bacterium]
MIHLAFQNHRLVVRGDDGDLAPRHESQLAYWGLQYDTEEKTYVSAERDMSHLAPKILAYFGGLGIACSCDENVRVILDAQRESQAALTMAAENGRKLKEGVLDLEQAREFLIFLESDVKRPLKDHQFKAALHLLCTENGANFSVPGSGKTAVVLTVFHRLRQLGQVDSLFVVGPPACFGPWRAEYEAVLGRSPRCEILAAGDIDARHDKYLVNRESACDLYLTTFQTLHRDWGLVQQLFQVQGVRFFLVVDEAHYIKQVGGEWAEAVLNVARHAARRCVLTGTPFPRNYTDSFNLFDVLWPEPSPISTEKRHQLELYTKRQELDRAARLLDDSIGPLFYRVRKADLGLAPQNFHPPMHVRMNNYERLVYDAILDRITNVSQSDYLRDFELRTRLSRGRMMRLRQCLSYTALLTSAVTEYSENLVGDDPSLSDVIKHYDELETPGKIEAILPLVSQLRQHGEKIVIWSNFVRTLKLLRERIAALGHGVQLIYGDTPTENANVRDELTREEIIRTFIDPTGGIDVLVANPAACAESISLHKTCSHAIYYDMSYNCAQYLQSLDRIHRVGGSEDKPSYYYFLQYDDSIDNDILANVQGKARNMSLIIDQDYPIYSLDMFAEDEEVQAYERLFRR